MRNIESQRKFTKWLAAISSATFLSRILGYVRDALVASYFGGGGLTDAFYAAFKIPNLLRRFLGEGSLTAAFVPVFTETLNKDGKSEAEGLFHAVFTGLLLILSVLVILGILFAPQVVRIVAWGFTSDPEKFDLTVRLTRLIFPFLLIVSLAALASAVLNSCGTFFIPAVAPSGLSIAEVGFIVLIASRMDSAIEGLAVSAVVGAGIHLAWQLPRLYQEGYHLRLVRPFSHPRVKMVFLLMGPTLLGLGVDQINSFVDQLCASFLRDGSVTALYNSNRVMQLPLALFGVAVASVALPALSKAANLGNTEEFKDTLNFSLRIANFVLIPATIGLVVVGYPIVQALFERGRFTPIHSRLTYSALAPYSLGLVAYSSAKILATSFYARKNTKTPVKVALWDMFLHAVMNVVLMRKFEVAGLALSTAISAWFQAIVLFLLLRKDMGVLGGRGLLSSFFYGSGAGLLMGGLCFSLSFVFLRGLPPVLKVMISVTAGTFFYLLASKIFRIKEYDYFRSALFQRKIKV